MPLLEAHSLWKAYHLGRQNFVQALRGVDIFIERGEMVAIMGPSGSGKSTLMHILGLLQSPDRGEGKAPYIAIDGTDAVDLSDGERTSMRARIMGFVFQSFNLVPTLTAGENVALAAEYAGSSRSMARSSAEDSLGWVGLGARINHRPAELSGGEQQRVAIARSLVNQPTLLLADEPTGNLDSANAGEVLDVLRRFNSEQGQTVVLVTHEVEVSAACARVIRMRDGVIHAEGA